MLIHYRCRCNTLYKLTTVLTYYLLRDQQRAKFLRQRRYVYNASDDRQTRQLAGHYHRMQVPTMKAGLNKQSV